jgi:hypothetical protein
MGFESIRVELRGGPATFSQVNEFVRQRPNVKPDTDGIRTPGSTFYTVEDGLHVIEVEVMASPITVSCRFTLCHPPSVDFAFLELVRELMAGLGMEAGICDDIGPEHSHWSSIAEFTEFADVLLHYVARRRAEWITNFGAAQFPAKTREVYERVILPRCEPVMGQAR